MGPQKEKNLYNHQAAEPLIESGIDRPGQFSPGARLAPNLSGALPYLVFVSATLLLFLFPQILIQDRVDVGAFNVCRFLAPASCGTSLWGGGLYGLVVVALFLLVRQSKLRRNAETILRTGQSEIGAVEEVSQIGIWSWEPDRDRVHLSIASSKLLTVGSHVPNNLSGFIDVFCAEDRQKLKRVFADAAATGHPFRAEVRTARTGGVVRLIQVSGKLVKNGNLSGSRRCIGILADVSGQKHVGDETEALRRELIHCMRGEVLGGLSGALAHELKQPLTAILSNAQAAERMLKRTPIDITAVKETIRDIIDDDSRASAAIVNLRSLVKNDERDWAMVNINQIARDALKIVNGALLQGNVELAAKLNDAPLCIRGNRIQLQQLILNLILDAAEAMNETTAVKKLEIETRNDRAGNAIILIGDSGRGIPEEINNRMFDPLFTTKVQGLGPGLSICRSIVAAHRGHLNTIKGKKPGATFLVTLPTSELGAKWSKMNVPLSSSSMMIHE